MRDESGLRLLPQYWGLGGFRYSSLIPHPSSVTPMLLLSFLNKWLHLMSIVGVLGAVLFMRFAVLPAFPGASLDETDTGRELRRQYGFLTGILWLIILVTGFLNYYLVANATPRVNGT